MPTFTERNEYTVEVTPPHYVLQCRRSDIVEKNNVEVGRTYHRHIVCPGDDLSGECHEVQTVATALWTPAVIAAYKASVAE